MNETAKSGGKEFSFVNNARFVSMIAVVAVHCTWGGNYLAHSGTFFLLQGLKFATIAFFICAGFLLGNKIVTDRPFSYFENRVKNVALPWSIWTGAFILLLVAKAFLMREAVTTTTWTDAALSVVFDTSYWFVPNLLLGLAILLTFRKWLFSPVLGACLGAVSLFYAANIYLDVMPTGHPSAVVGFIFYIWLGVNFFRQKDAVVAYLARVPWSVIFLTVLLTYALAMWETNYIKALGGLDPLNSVKISNQIFSLAVFAMLVKSNWRMVPSAMKVREVTFGIYLIHPWMILFVNILVGAVYYRLWVAPAGEANTLLMLRAASASSDWLFAYPVTLVPVYLLSWALTVLLIRLGLGFTVGQTSAMRSRLRTVESKATEVRA